MALSFSQQLGKKEPVEEQHEKILERNPDDVEALRMVLYGKIRKGEMEKAVKFMERLIRLEPDEEEWKLMKLVSDALVGDFWNVKNLFGEIFGGKRFGDQSFCV